MQNLGWSGLENRFCCVFVLFVCFVCLFVVVIVVALKTCLHFSSNTGSKLTLTCIIHNFMNNFKQKEFSNF